MYVCVHIYIYIHKQYIKLHVHTFTETNIYKQQYTFIENKHTMYKLRNKQTHLLSYNFNINYILPFSPTDPIRAVGRHLRDVRQAERRDAALRAAEAQKCP